MLCFNCSSSSIVLTDENSTCLDCSRVQEEVFNPPESYSCDDLYDDYEDINDFISEYHQRENLSAIERVSIRQKLLKVKNMKSAFSKVEISLSLIYLSKLEGEAVRSVQAFSKACGGLVTAKRLDLCLRHLRRVLNIPKDSLNWRMLLNPYCQKYILLRALDLNYLEMFCERIHKSSCMNVFSVAATAAACYLKIISPLNQDENFSSIASFSKISNSTLRKNCLKYSKLVPVRLKDNNCK